MPLLHVFSPVSASLEPAARTALLGDLSRALATYFGKPETWVMTGISAPLAMTFGGTVEPACYAEIKNIGVLAPADSERISADLTGRLSRGLGVPPGRVYIEFTEATGKLWGWNGETFG